MFFDRSLLALRQMPRGVLLQHFFASVALHGYVPLHPSACRGGLLSPHHDTAMPAEPLFAEFAESCLRPRFEQAKLGLRQSHFPADLFLGLLAQIEARQDLAVAARDALEHLQGDAMVLLADGGLLRVRPAIPNRQSRIQIGLVLTVLDV